MRSNYICVTSMGGDAGVGDGVVYGKYGCRWNNLLVKHAEWGRGGGDIGVKME